MSSIGELTAPCVGVLVDSQGRIALPEFPKLAGRQVRVIILPEPVRPVPAEHLPLRGAPVKLHDPTEPVGEDDWEALQ
jgi:hypothetical protein